MSMQSWIVEHIVPLLYGRIGVAELDSEERLEVDFAAFAPPFAQLPEHLAFTPMVTFRRTRAGELLWQREQQIYLGYLRDDTTREDLPNEERQSAAREVVGRWRERAAQWVTELASTDVEGLMPSDVSWPTSVLDLVVVVLRHGPPGPRPMAGEVGSHGLQSASTLRKVDLAKLDCEDAIAAYSVAGYTLGLQRPAAEEDEPTQELLLLRREGGPWLPIVCSLSDGEGAYSCDADEPAYRLFATWLRLGLTQCGIDRELPGGGSVSNWLLLDDRRGEPLDHRVVTGMVRAESWAELDSSPTPDDPDASTTATQLFRAFLREVVDPEVRFGVKTCELGCP